VGADEVEPARFAEHELSQAVRDQLGGATGAPAVTWAWQGSEIVLYLNSVEVALTPGQLRVQLDCETDQTGRVAQEIRIALPDPAEQPNFVATADLIPDGDERISARWGGPLQDAIWRAVLGLAGEGHPAGVAAGQGAVIVHPGDLRHRRSADAREVAS
jgi:hypothetical protein